MKLELKHLAGYLPYGLNYKDIPDGFNGIRELDIKTLNWCLVNGEPILRPLSDLTKEIEVNGEKFVPHLELGGRPNLKDYDFVYFKKNIENLSFGLIQQLLEWHFDIYGLIENNLAIDINTLNNDN